MRKTHPTIAALVAVTIAFAACETQTGEEAGMTDEAATADTAAATSVDTAEREAAFDALRSDYVDAYNAHDAAGAAAFYVEEGVQFPPDGPRIEGRDAIRQSFEETFTASPEATISIEVEDTEIAASGDMATAHGTFTVSNLGPDAPAPEASYQFAAGYRWVDGGWKITGVIWNGGGPVMEAAEPNQ